MTERGSIDLDAVGEELLDAYDVTIGGRTYEFPAVLGAKALKGFVPLLAKIEGINTESPSPEEMVTIFEVIEQILAALVGPDQADEIIERATVPKLLNLVERLFQVYGLGEAAASTPSSKNGGGKSRPTSNGSTASTSAANT